jgi:hypothetical protein
MKNHNYMFKHQIISYLTICYCFLAFSQETVEKTIGDFNIVKVYDLINVEMVKSDSNQIQITGVHRNDVELVNRNGTLKIRMNPVKSFDGDDVYVTLFYKLIDVIDANEGSEIKVRDLIDQYEIDLKAQEGAEIEAQLKVTYANIKSITGGIITAKGASTNQDVSVYTGGVFQGEDLETSFSEVSIQAGGEIYVNCKDRLDIKIRAGGNVYVYGNPKVIDEKRVLGGRVRRME